MKSFIVFILACLIPSASFQSSTAPDIPTEILKVLFPSLPGLIANLTKLSEDATNGIPIDESTLDGINDGLQDFSRRLRRLYFSSDLIFAVPSSARDLLSSQITEIRNEAAKLPINPLGTLQNLDVNAIFDETMIILNGLAKETATIS